MESVEQRVAAILREHQAGRVEQDCDEGCCWLHYCTCGQIIHPGEDSDDYTDEYELDDLVRHQVKDIVDQLRRDGDLTGR